MLTSPLDMGELVGNSAAREFFLLLNCTRGGQPALGALPPGWISRPAGKNVIKLWSESADKPGALDIIHVIAFGESAEIVRVIAAEDGKGVAVYDAMPENMVDLGTALEPNPKDVKLEFDTPQSYCEELVSWLGNIAQVDKLGELKRYQAFFSYLDLVSLSDLNETTATSDYISKYNCVFENNKMNYSEFKQQINRAIKHVTSLLQLRMSHRKSCTHQFLTASRDDCPLAPVTSKTIEATYEAQVTAMFERIAGHFLGDLNSEEAIQHWDGAFHAFASGLLRAKLPTSLAWVCQPSSGFYFLFGEFALLAATNKPDSFWPKLCPSTVATQKIFVSAYPANPDLPLGTESYNPMYFEPSQVWGKQAAGVLFSDYKSLDLAGLSTRACENVKQFLPEIK